MKKKHKKKMMHHEMWDDASPMQERSMHEKKPEMWISGAIKHPGALREELHVKKGKKIPLKKLEKAAHKKGKEGQRARLAETLRKMRHKKKDK